MSRPAYTSRATATTMVSNSSYESSNRPSAISTHLKTPDLPGRLDPFQFQPIPESMEAAESLDSIYSQSQIGRDLGRGPSVKDRASRFEQESTRPLPAPTTRTPGSSGRKPVPQTAPRLGYTSRQATSPPTRNRSRRSPELKRGSGSAKRMIQQWESLPSTPAGQGRVISRDYLDQKPLPPFSQNSRPLSYPSGSRGSPDKPLPLPTATPIPASSQYSPNRATPTTSRYVPSPLQHLQTPQSRKRSATLTQSPSSYSISPSPSGEKRKKPSRSPLKDIMGVFGGGIQGWGRKVRGKGKEKEWDGGDRQRMSLDDDWDMKRVGTNGLPGGIVYSDRMGDQEMEKSSQLENTVRTSAIMYLTPTPCSSLSPWGAWLPSYANLSSSTLKITYCPLFPGPNSGNSTPRRVLSGMPSAVAYASIPVPQPGTSPDVELAMSECIEVRSLRREEVKGRGVPAVPEGVGTEVLEMVWTDGSKRYIGVEGVGGRLGWVSAIWDVLLACKATQPLTLPPPSPAPEPASSAPPVQKVGDTWVAASGLGASDLGSNLRDSVQRMFDNPPDEPVHTDDWPKTERELSIFSRHTDTMEQEEFPKSDSILSFDPNDLNPSRSASQVRRKSTIGRQIEPPRQLAPDRPSPILEEPQSDLALDVRRPAMTHISHVTFPKPTVGGQKMMDTFSSGSSNDHTGETTGSSLRTQASSLTSVSVSDPTVIAKLESHTTEHGTISKQVDNVQVDLRRIIGSLATFKPETVPKALEEKLTSIHLDVKGVENALQLSTLATNRQAAPEDAKIQEIHAKLDNIVRLCEEALKPPPAAAVAKVVTEEEKKAGQEVAKIMSEVSPASPRKASVHVLSVPPSPNPSVKSMPSPNPSAYSASSTITPEATKQLTEVLGLVKELQGARTVQTQQTTDIARYLNELNTWLEKFVMNGTNELSQMSKKLDSFVGPETEGNTPILSDIHGMMTDQKRRNDCEGPVGQRLDALLGMMGEERERQAGQHNIMEQVVAILDRQRHENELLLRALAQDLTGEIRGERIRFVEAMQQATSVNVQLHVEEFKKLLSTEVNRSMKELGQMREQRKALEHQISDLFALKAKHGTNSGENSRGPSTPAPRGLQMTPAGHGPPQPPNVHG